MRVISTLITLRGARCSADDGRVPVPLRRPGLAGLCLTLLAAGQLGLGAATAAAPDVVAGPSSARAPAESQTPAPERATAQPPSRPADESQKGVGAWHVPHVAASLRRSGVSWFYNWDADFDYHVPARVDYVPMIWGAAQATPQRLAQARQHGPDLLTFNEPDNSKQADLTVDQALDLWPTLQATGMRLSSPAVSYGGDDPHGWLARFMRGAVHRHDRVDFVALHWYGADFDPARATQQLHDYLVRVHQRYGKPVWLTEFALMRFTGGRAVLPPSRQQADFAAQAVGMLDRLPWVERYAWFAMPAPASGASTGLYRPDGRATRVGRAFADARG